MIDFSLPVILAEAGIFIFTLVMLNMILFRPLTTFMEKREEKLNQDLESISKNTEETEQYEEEIASILNAAKAEVAKIKADAIENAEKEADALLSKERKEIAIKKELFLKELANEKTSIEAVLTENYSELESSLLSKMEDVA